MIHLMSHAQYTWSSFHGFSFCRLWSFYQLLVPFLGEYDISLNSLSYKNQKIVLHRKNFVFYFSIQQDNFAAFGPPFWELDRWQKGDKPKEFFGRPLIVSTSTDDSSMLFGRVGYATFSLCNYLVLESREIVLTTLVLLLHVTAQVAPR